MKTVRMLFGLFVVASVVYLGWKIVPVYFSNYQFEEAMDDTARMAAVDLRKSPDELRNLVFESARSFEIPLTADDINVTRDGGNVVISAEYTVHIDAPIYPFDLKFTPSTNRQALNFK
jgi:predicted membrane protein